MAVRVTDGIPVAEVRDLAAAGVPIRALAARYGVGYSTMRTWMVGQGIETPRARRLAETKAARESEAPTVEAHCPEHGRTLFVRRGRGFRCARCRVEAVGRRRRSVKELLVAELGGRCRLCGYARSLAALHFHHVEPAKKRFALSHRGVTRSVEEARAEAARCVLVCANCHAEIEAGVAQLPFTAAVPDAAPSDGPG
jgi:hypothetical protein